MSYLRKKLQLAREREQGKVGWILLWLLGVPIPILLVRTQLSAAHTREQLDRAVAAFSKVGKQLRVV